MSPCALAAPDEERGAGPEAGRFAVARGQGSGRGRSRTGGAQACGRVAPLEERGRRTSEGTATRSTAAYSRSSRASACPSAVCEWPRAERARAAPSPRPHARRRTPCACSALPGRWPRRPPAPPPRSRASPAASSGPRPPGPPASGGRPRPGGRGGGRRAGARRRGGEPAGRQASAWSPTSWRRAPRGRARSRRPVPRGRARSGPAPGSRPSCRFRAHRACPGSCRRPGVGPGEDCVVIRRPAASRARRDPLEVMHPLLPRELFSLPKSMRPEALEEALIAITRRRWDEGLQVARRVHEPAAHVLAARPGRVRDEGFAAAPTRAASHSVLHTAEGGSVNGGLGRRSGPLPWTWHGAWNRLGLD